MWIKSGQSNLPGIFHTHTKAFSLGFHCRCYYDYIVNNIKIFKIVQINCMNVTPEPLLPMLPNIWRRVKNKADV